MMKRLAMKTTTTLVTCLTVLVLLAPAGTAWAKDHKVEIADIKYKPAKLKLKKGDTVVWTNTDDRDHTVVCKDKDKAKTFDSGKIAAGDKFEFKFEKAGKYEYGCNYHPRMKGVIEVED